MLSSILKGRRTFYSKESLIRLEIIFAILFEQFFAMLFENMDNIVFSYLAINVFSFIFFCIFIASFFINQIKRNLRGISNGIYLSGILFVLYTAYANDFNKGSFYVIIIVYSFINVMFSSIRVFLRVNAVVFLALIALLALNDFNTETSILNIFSTMFLLGVAGFSITLSRIYYRRKIKERGKLLRFIFNQTPGGLLLVNKKENKIVNINDTALKILEVNHRADILGKRLFEITLDGKKVLEDTIEIQQKCVELKSGKIIIVETKQANYQTKDFILVNLKEYQESEINKSAEFNAFKNYSEENYESLFENSSTLMCIIDKKGNIIDINKGVSQLIGYEKNELIGSKYDDYDARDYKKEREIINEKAWQGKKQQFEKAILSKGNEVIHIEVILQKGKHFGEEVLISNFRDITERKSLEEKALYNFGMYQTLFSESPIGIVVADLEGNIKETNKAFQKLLGYTQKEFLQLNVADFSTDQEMQMNIAQREKLIKGEIDAIEMSKRYITKKGDSLFCLLKIILQKDSLGRPETLLAQIVNITEIQETEKKLKESEKSYKDIFNNTYELMYIVNKDNQFIDVNKAVIEKYGYSKEEIMGGDPLIFSAEGKNDLVTAAEKTEKVWQGQEQEMFWWSKKKDGTIFPKILQMRKGVYFGEEVLFLSGRDISEQKSYENKLERSRKKYKELIDSSIVGVIIFKEEEIVFANKKVAEILNIADENTLVGRKRVEFIQEKDKAVYKERLTRLYSGEDVEMREFTIFDNDRKKIEVEIKPKLIDFEGNPCIMLSVLDITDRKKAEEAKKKIQKAKTTNLNLKYQLEQNRLIQKELFNSKAYTEGIIESSLDMIFTANKEGKVIRLNPAAKKELQFTAKEEYIGKPFDFFFEKKKDAKEIADLLEDNRPFSGEVNLLRKDGSKFTSFLSINNLISTDNQFVGIMGISRDISDIKAKENEIKKQASKLNAIIESSSHFFFTIDKKRKITSFNKPFQEDVESKYKHRIAVGESFFSIYKIDQREMDRKEIELFWEEKFKSVFEGNNERFENKRYDSEGNVFYREVYLNPIYNKSGSIKEVSCIGHDTTKQRTAERELQNSLEEKNVLLQEVHHRVKNNMQVISSILSLQSTYVRDEDTINILRESQNRIRAMAAIHEKLYRTKNFSDIKFSSYVQNLAQNIIETYELSNKTVELSCKLDEVFLTLDVAIPCGLIINELITNSLKYAFNNKEKGLITVDLINQKEKVVLRIADDGIGLPSDIDFRKTESLGLQLVSTLIEQIEGTIEREKREGTAYKIEFSPK